MIGLKATVTAIDVIICAILAIGGLKKQTLAESAMFLFSIIWLSANVWMMWA